MIRLLTDEERKDLSRTEITVTEQHQIIDELKEVSPHEILLVCNGIRHRYMTGFGLCYYFRSEKHNSTIEAYRAQPKDPFTARIQKVAAKPDGEIEEE
ncbi:hypothetical protein HYZ99_05840 [Candidatus Peregrinibacteria bacterium]|nr:hypothetical protein [Candidatus Peregrinibacteria bacterium]